MDRFLNKRSRSDEVSASPPASKRPRSSAKQGNVTAAVRVAEFGKQLFYADGGKLFCRFCKLGPGRRSFSEGHGQAFEVEGN